MAAGRLIVEIKDVCHVGMNVTLTESFQKTTGGKVRVSCIVNGQPLFKLPLLSWLVSWPSLWALGATASPGFRSQPRSEAVLSLAEAHIQRVRSE